MKKRILLALLAAALMLSLCACTAQTPATPSAADQGLSEVLTLNAPDTSNENTGVLLSAANVDANGNKVYAGATPIPIDPVDMPTATPRPDLTFEYGEYVASKLGLRFRSAVGYEINDSLLDTYILTEPAAAVKDNYPCVISLEITTVPRNYSNNDIKNALSTYLQNEGRQYSQWQTWTAASSKLMGGNGYYNNYRGVLSDGTIVRGRVHMALISETKLLTLHISCPGWYNTSYMKIYDQIRSSITAIQ